MYLKTHLMLAILVILVFISHVKSQWVFAGMVLIATVVPDLDSSFSSWGRHLMFRPLQFFTKHRGIIHSFLTAIILSLIIAVWFPVASFGFFIGYCVHLFSDSFTIEGIQPFWPMHYKSTGPIASGGKIEETLFLSLIIINFLVFVFLLI